MASVSEEVFILKKGLRFSDSEVYQSIEKELQRQRSQLQLIASENFASRAVMEAQGSFLTNKYAEGYPGKRYYCGCEYVDKVENLAIKRLCKLFGVKFANVQPHSGSQVNQALFASLLAPDDAIPILSLSCGGQLTHGATLSLSGKLFESIQDAVSREVDIYIHNKWDHDILLSCIGSQVNVLKIQTKLRRGIITIIVFITIIILLNNLP